MKSVTEIWKAVVGHEGAYEVSDHGRVRSITRTIMLRRKDGIRPWIYRGRVLKPTPASHHYPTVKIRGRGECVHVMVLTAFTGPCPEGSQCRHLDGDRSNPRLDNLCWGTRTENSADSMRHGTRMRGTKFPLAVLDDDKVRMIKASVLSTRDLAEQLKVCDETVRRVRVGKGWIHVT